MPQLRRLLFIAVAMLSLALLFNIFGYYYIDDRTAQSELRREGEILADNQQVLGQQVVRNITSLTIHHSLAPEQYQEQLKTLKQNTGLLKTGQQALKTILFSKKFNGNSEFRESHEKATNAFDSIYNYALPAFAPSSVLSNTDYAQQGRLRTHEAAYLSALHQLRNTFNDSEKELDNDIRRMNKAIVISLVLTLLFLIVLITAPIFRQSIRNYKQLQTTLIEVKRSEEIIQESERKYRHLFERNPLPMWIYDNHNFRFLEVNQMAVQHYGYSTEEFACMTIFDIRPEQEKPRLESLVHNKKRDDLTYPQGIWTHMKKNGETIFAEIISHRINYNGKEATLVLSKDVTRNMQLQKELLDEKIAHQREMAKASIAVQEQERGEIGKELHDNVNQILTTAKLHLDFMSSPEADQEKHREMSLKLVVSAIQEIRRLSKSLVPRSLDDVGLISSIEDIVANINTLQSLQLHFEHNHFDEERLDAGLKLTLLRIIQEQTTNILKYAQASHASISLTHQRDGVHLEIKDDGKGFDITKSRKGIGFTNIINRADIYQGKVELDAAPQKGCKLSIHFLPSHALVSAAEYASQD
ncbi:MAG: domain S-box protein [Flaviaesturariibacter sp.]|nr:domain S-box protein [Flaviaesturariibacter sp.]